MDWTRFPLDPFPFDRTPTEQPFSSERFPLDISAGSDEAFGCHACFDGLPRWQAEGMQRLKCKITIIIRIIIV